jgi:ferredoxin-NADP reductase
MICLAGGCGVTPFISMIREITERGLKRSINLFHGHASTDDMIFHDELSALAEEFDNINYTPVVENPGKGYEGKTGFITGQLVVDVCGKPDGKSYFICGPQAMYTFCMAELEKIGVPTRRIRHEMFGMPDDITQTFGWPPEIKNEDTFTVKVNGSREISAKASDSLLKTLENNGLIVPFNCRAGECSMCRIKILSGKVFQPAGVAVRESDKLHAYVHSCAAYPIEDIEILL